MEEKMLREMIENLKKNLDKQQEFINECRNQVINLEKELISDPQIGGIKTTYKMLEEAENIYFGEVDIEVNLSSRASNAIRRSSQIKTLRDLYNLILDNQKCIYIRNLGQKSFQEISLALVDMEKIILKIKKRREDVEKFNQPLEFLLDKKIAERIELRYKVKTLKDLYNFYAKYELTYFENAKEVKSLLRNY